MLTNDVVRLANFYKELFGIDNGSNDWVHQFLIVDETTLTVFNDGSYKNNDNRNICLAFTVEDVDEAYRRLKTIGVTIVEQPQERPWGAKNMCFCDPDGNRIYLRSFEKRIEQ